MVSCIFTVTFLLQNIKLQSLLVPHTVKVLPEFSVVVCCTLLLARTYLFLILNCFTVLQFFLGITSDSHGRCCLGEAAWASVARGTWHSVSGSGFGHGLWLLELSLGVQL